MAAAMVVRGAFKCNKAPSASIDGQRQAAAFDLVSIRRGEMDDRKVYSGDIVIVDGSSIKETQKQLFWAFPLLTIFRPMIL